MEIGRIRPVGIELREGVKIYSSKESCLDLLQLVRRLGGDGNVTVNEGGDWSIYVTKTPSGGCDEYEQVH